MQAQSQTPAPYTVADNDEATIARAMEILWSRVNGGDLLTSPQAVRQYLALHTARYSAEGREVFGVILLDAQHRAVECVDLFFGTLSQTSVYPREVVKLALSLNAAAVVLYHNHPSGSTEPSRADEHLTQTLKQALALVDCRVLDHFVVGGAHVTSFAERGLI